MTWGRARATRSSSQTWTSTRSRIWCGMSTVAGEKCESTFYCWISLAVGWATSQTSLTFFWVLLTSMTSGDLEWSTSCRSAGSNSNRKLPSQISPKNEGKITLEITFGHFVTYKSTILFSLQRLEGRMLSVIVSEPCRWPGDLIQLSWSGSATQVWCKTDGIFLGCWYFGPLRLAQGCGVENHCHIISSCPQGRGLQPARLEDKAEGWSFEDLPVSKLFLRDTLTCSWKCWSRL